MFFRQHKHINTAMKQSYQAIDEVEYSTICETYTCKMPTFNAFS